MCGYHNNLTENQIPKPTSSGKKGKMCMKIFDNKYLCMCDSWCESLTIMMMQQYN